MISPLGKYLKIKSTVVILISLLVNYLMSVPTSSLQNSTLLMVPLSSTSNYLKKALGLGCLAMNSSNLWIPILAIFFLTLYTKNQIEEGSFFKRLPHISPKLEPDRDILSYSTNLECYKYPCDSVQKIDHPFSFDQKRLSGGSDNLY